jgi:hypothetical protein
VLAGCGSIGQGDWRGWLLVWMPGWIVPGTGVLIDLVTAVGIESATANRELGMSLRGFRLVRLG